ncbi:hypothetical protein [Antrihabitans cavernicola]|uniref:Serine hydrolase n=1 Tax=Antrihabitans cavernicola TaxID=2495913 RepID=A0A5A7S6C2_9NOCA|nr:hypothetical protein [Spelaeibacter cavernicola]KAA0016322.1 hypothetical protein FOY51_26590 [Spelaeibacter cavernicola]
MGKHRATPKRHPLVPIALLTPAAVAGIAIAAAPVAQAAPNPVDNLSTVPGRTSLSFDFSPLNVRVGTPNSTEARSGLSTVKLYIADYALRHGDGSASDRDLAQRMIQLSDDNAAQQLDAKYPNALDADAAEYHLTSTHRGSFWGDSVTSTADTVTFLEAKKATDPMSPILGWMATANPVAADGTHQDWGTAHLPGVIGTKWGWSDEGSPEVASASFGPDFSVAAQTEGSAADETADVQNGFGPAGLPPLPRLDQLITDFNNGLQHVLPH